MCRYTPAVQKQARNVWRSASTQTITACAAAGYATHAMKKCTPVPAGPSLHVPCFEQSVQSTNWATRMHNMGEDGYRSWGHEGMAKISRDHITHILMAGRSRPPFFALALEFSSTTARVHARVLVGLFGVRANTGVGLAVILILVAKSSHPLAHMHAQTHARAHKFGLSRHCTPSGDTTYQPFAQTKCVASRSRSLS